MGNGVTECGWCHAPEVHGGFWEFEESWVELRTGHRTKRLTFACSRRPWASAARDVGGRWKSQNRKIVPLSSYVEKPLNSKVIKSFVLEPRSRKCFSCFEIPMFYIYIYIYMNIIRPFCISISGHGTVRKSRWTRRPELGKRKCLSVWECLINGLFYSVSNWDPSFHILPCVK